MPLGGAALYSSHSSICMHTPRWLQTFDAVMDAALPGERHPVGSPIPEPTYVFPPPAPPRREGWRGLVDFGKAITEIGMDYRAVEEKALEQWD